MSIQKKLNFTLISNPLKYWKQMLMEKVFDRIHVPDYHLQTQLFNARKNYQYVDIYVRILYTLAIDLLYRVFRKKMPLHSTDQVNVLIYIIRISNSNMIGVCNFPCR
jgi:hypothetical protein